MGYSKTTSSHAVQRHERLKKRKSETCFQKTDEDKVIDEQNRENETVLNEEIATPDAENDNAVTNVSEINEVEKLCVGTQTDIDLSRFA